MIRLLALFASIGTGAALWWWLFRQHPHRFSEDEYADWMFVCC